MVSTDYPVIDAMWLKYGATSGTYPDLDRFNRITSSRWTKDLATDRDFYDVDITCDRSSNITWVEDNVHGGFDVKYTIDDLDRLTQAEEGTKSGSSIASRSRDQQWTLDQLGNWDVVKLDLDGDNNFSETGEFNDDRTYNVVNELTARDTDDDGSDDYTLTFDAVGNLTDDGEHYEYEYDAFGRLRQVKDTDDQSLVAEYTYNGLGYRIGWHYDVDVDGDVDGSDSWFRFVYDARWRIVGTYRASDSDPKELFVYHAPGDGGLGGYMDDVILREKDANSGWNSAADGTLEERLYYFQNWRHDVVALLDSSGGQVEQDRYSSNGDYNGLPAGDMDNDGDVDPNDLTVFDGLGAYDVRGDLDLDGDNDNDDRPNDHERRVLQRELDQ